MAEYYIATIVTLYQLYMHINWNPQSLSVSHHKCSVKQIMAYVIDPRIPLNLSNLKHQIKFLDGFEGPYTANTSSPLLMCEG